MRCLQAKIGFCAVADFDGFHLLEWNIVQISAMD